MNSLFEPVQAGGVITLEAGPGYGKTSLIVDLLSAAPGRTVYFSLDEGDQDAVRFLTYFLAGLGVDPSDIPTERSSESTLSGMPYATLDLTGMVVDHMSAHAGEPTFIAIDDFYLVESSPGVVSSLSLMLRSLPPNWTVLISSRRPIPLDLGGLRLGGRVAKVKARQLRLTPNEVTQWAAQNWNLELQRSEAKAVWRLTEGWPAALVLLGRRLLSSGDTAGHEALASALARETDLQDFLEQDILGGLDPFAAQTMMTAALLPRVIFPRDEGFLPGEPGEAEAVLDEFVSQGFLVTRNGRRTYTVHPLVREFVLRKTGDAERPAPLTYAAMHLEQVGEPSRAVEFYLRLGRFDDAARLIRSMTIELPDSSMSQAREEWLALIPDAILTNPVAAPWLVVAKAQVRQKQASFPEATALYARAAETVVASGDTSGLLPILLASAYCLLRQRRWEEALGVLQRCRGLTRTWADEVGVLLAESLILGAMCRWNEADANYEKCLSHLPPGPQAVAARQRICMHRGIMTFRLGQYYVSKMWLQKSLAYGETASPFGYCAALCNSAGCALLLGEYERAAAVTEECYRIVRSRGYAFLEPWWAVTQGVIAEGGWNYPEAVARYKEARTVSTRLGSPDDHFWADLRLGDVRRHEGDTQGALQHHRAALDRVTGDRFGLFEQVQAQTSMAIDMVFANRRDQAEEAVTAAADLARRFGFLASLALLLLYSGWLHAVAGRGDEAVRCLEEALSTGEENGHIHHFVQEATVALPIFALSDRLGVASAFIRNEIVPRLPGDLQSRFVQIAEANVNPATLPLGRLRRSTRTANAPGEGNDTTTQILDRIRSLTDREREILGMLAQGMANKAIASSLSITEGTVKTHVNHILRKLGVTNRFQAILIFREHL